MGLFLAYILKSAIYFLFFFTFNKLFLSKETFHVFNRAMWLSIVGISLVLPFFDWQPLEWQTEHTMTMTTSTINEVSYQIAETPLLPVEPLEPDNSAEVFSLVKYSLIIYALIACILVLKLLVSYLRLFTLILPRRADISCGLNDNPENKEYLELFFRCKKIVGIKRKVHFVVHDKKINPFSWMNYVVISKEDLDENAREIIIHELSHVRHHHSWDLILADLLIIFQWFNPAAWLYKQSLQQTHEYKADESVLEAGVNAKLYQLLLIKKAVGQRFYSMANSLNHSKLKKRITMMLKEKSNKWATAKCFYALPLAFIALSAIATPRISNHLDKISSVKITQNSENTAILAEEIVNQEPEKTTALMKHANATIGDKVIQHYVSIRHSETNDSIVNHYTYYVKGDYAPEDSRYISMAVSTVLNGSLCPKDKAKIVIFLDGVEISTEGCKTITPEEIKHISILRDDVTDSLYGSKAKNGVILITTKKGTTYAPKITLDSIKISEKEFNAIDPDDIKLINVSKEDKRISITTKKGEKEDEPVRLAEHEALYNGKPGLAEFSKWCQTNLIYPQAAADKGIGGKVYVEFVIQKDGKLTDIKLVRGVNKELDKATLDIVKKAPANWTPAKNGKKPVALKMQLAITYSLN